MRCGGRGCGRLLIFQQMPPAKMQIESVLPHQKRVIHRQPIHMRQAPLSPPCQRGVVLPLAKPGGFLRLAGFHISLYHGEVPTVNPSVTATPCQLPLAREPLGCGVGNGLLQDSDFQQMPPAKMQIESVLSHQKRMIHRQPIHTQQAPISPPCQRGVVLPLAKPGGFLRLAGFHISLYHGEVPTVNPSVTATPCQLPLAREPLGCGVGNGLLKDSDFQQMPPAKKQIEAFLPHTFPPSRKKDRHRAGF